MSRLTDLIAQTKARDAELDRELEREFKVLSERRSFGLNFERHRPESVDLLGRPVRKGDKVRVLPPRGSTGKGDQRLRKVAGFARQNGARLAWLEMLGVAEPETTSVAVEDSVIVSENRDYIYPGLVSTGKVERAGGKPFHTAINGENFHVLESSTYTHRGKIDVIYIDPRYNTGARDWKYNNNCVDGEDLYQHSKWLSDTRERVLQQFNAAVRAIPGIEECYMIAGGLDYLMKVRSCNLADFSASWRRRFRACPISTTLPATFRWRRLSSRTLPSAERAEISKCMADNADGRDTSGLARTGG